ncbi:hypothetical protein Q5P01_005972 [Channa striata]|uniref:Ig-like domain-containing protein n=1 Tax=Channa striata TaxID=64152 RepID=A0AA88NEY0_CHASR|nr:hypothetical protein Q5P01_005972 [Channa striata]
MDLIWIILPVVLVCARAQNVTEVRVKLGQSVTLNCSVDNSDVHCSMSKYSAWENSLMISNITTEDRRLYFCGRKINDDIQFVDRFTLVSDVPASPSNNVSEGNNDDQQPNVMCQNKLVICGSYALNALLLLGLFSALVCLKRNNCRRQVTDPPPLQTSDSQQYAEIQFRPFRAPPPAPSQCIYSRAQLPGC